MVGFKALRDINKDEELLTSYGETYWKGRSKFTDNKIEPITFKVPFDGNQDWYGNKDEFNRLQAIDFMQTYNDRLNECNPTKSKDNNSVVRKALLIAEAEDQHTAAIVQNLLVPLKQTKEQPKEQPNEKPIYIISDATGRSFTTKSLNNLQQTLLKWLYLSKVLTSDRNRVTGIGSTELCGEKIDWNNGKPHPMFFALNLWVQYVQSIDDGPEREEVSMSGRPAAKHWPKFLEKASDILKKTNR